MEYKRQSKHPSEETKRRISQSLKGRTCPDATKAKIAASMRRYWGNEANFPDDTRHEGTGDGWIETGDIV